MREHADAPVSAGLESASAAATDRRPGSPDARIRVGIIGATGYVGAELIRILSRHPRVEIVGLQGRDRDGEPIGATHAHLAGTGLLVAAGLPAVDAVFLALPHGTAATTTPNAMIQGTRLSSPVPA